MHALHLSMLREKIGDLRRVFAMRAHSPRQRAHAAQYQPAIKRRGDRAARILNAANALEKFIFDLADNDSAKHIAMAAKIFRGRMQNKIGPQIERPLNDRRPGVVTNRNCTNVTYDLRYRGKIDDAQ